MRKMFKKRNQRRIEHNVQMLDENIMIVIPSVNKFLTTFGYYLSQDLGKKDMKYLEMAGDNAVRIHNLLYDLCKLAEDSVKLTIALEGAWPKKRKWYHLFSKNY